MAESALITDLLKQAPSVGVGLFVFLAYQRLVGKMLEVVAASTQAIAASTAAMEALKEAVEEAVDRAQQMSRDRDWR